MYTVRCKLQNLGFYYQTWGFPTSFETWGFCSAIRIVWPGQIQRIVKAWAQGHSLCIVGRQGLPVYPSFYPTKSPTFFCTLSATLSILGWVRTYHLQWGGCLESVQPLGLWRNRHDLHTPKELNYFSHLLPILQTGNTFIISIDICGRVGKNTNIGWTFVQTPVPFHCKWWIKWRWFSVPSLIVNLPLFLCQGAQWRKQPQVVT